MTPQRHSVDVITGTLQANLATPISFKATSRIESRAIPNDQGAEQLLGQGGMPLTTSGGDVLCVHDPCESNEKVVSACGSPKIRNCVAHAPKNGSMIFI
jgi:DNA segregation ATPase FtsK/SpoIIIE-like protein